MLYSSSSAEPEFHFRRIVGSITDPSGSRRGALRRKAKGRAVFGVFKKVWMPLLLVVVVALGGYTVVRIRNTFGSNGAVTSGEGAGANTKPFNPNTSPMK